MGLHGIHMAPQQQPNFMRGTLSERRYAPSIERVELETPHKVFFFTDNTGLSEQS